ISLNKRNLKGLSEILKRKNKRQIKILRLIKKDYRIILDIHLMILFTQAEKWVGSFSKLKGWHNSIQMFLYLVKPVLVKSYLHKVFITKVHGIRKSLLRKTVPLYL